MFGYKAFITIYMLIVLGIGIYMSKKIKTMDDFALAGRQLTTPLLVGTLFASITGGATVVGWTGSFYLMGTDWWWGFVGTLVGFMLVTFFMAERSRRLEQYTLPDMLRLRFDANTATAGSIMIVIGDISMTCVQILSAGGILSGFLGLPRTLGLIIAAVAFILIAYYGGMKGVALTDALQALFIFVGLALGAFFALNAAGGLDAVVSRLPAGFLTPFTHTKPTNALGNALALVGTTAVWQSVLFSRLFAAKSPKVAKQSMLYFLPFDIIAMICVFVMGISARVILGEGVEPGTVFATLVSNVYNPVIGAILIAVVVGALLTTANTILLSISINITRDIYQNVFRPQATDKQAFNFAKNSVVVIGVLALLMAVLMPNIVNAMVFTYTMYSAALFVPIYGGYLWKRATATGAFLSILSGAGIALLWNILGTPFGLHPMLPAALASAIALVVGSYLSEPPTKEQLKVFEIAK
jgi:SSS family solute:Na+ symporter